MTKPPASSLRRRTRDTTLPLLVGVLGGVFFTILMEGGNPIANRFAAGVRREFTMLGLAGAISPRSPIKGRAPR